ncbi:L-tartrate/succinate antiporter [Cupriavidus laharis]|uniref:L-tartrate/succinate antiporter n=2 Tax=Cupriavidus laharis TaxID=151654 RepID=A0ABM8XS23_9BURK|nr:L-tartrate/succinate antiporter [Cupriavidus laharis]
MLEPLRGAAIGMIAVTMVAILGEWVFFSPEQLAKAGFNPGNASLAWALSGLANSTVWLIFGAFMFAMGYEKTGLGRRIALLPATTGGSVQSLASSTLSPSC